MAETSDGVPITDGFDYPVGQRGTDPLTTHKVDSTLADSNYFQSFKVWHTGEDWNGRGGGDSDLGHPVYAVSNGLVVEASYTPVSWGNIVVIEHALPDNSRVWSQYAHLQKMLVGPGQKVTRGQQIGTIGKGAKTDKFPQGRWIAHLHFEIRRTRLPSNNWLPMVRDREQVLTNYYSPTPFIQNNRPEKYQKLAQQAAQVANTLVIDSQRTNLKHGLFRRARGDAWHTAKVGYQGSMLWAFSAAQTTTAWGEWWPRLQAAGNWHGWVFIPAANATTTNARYHIVHAGGRTDVVINQSQYSHQWVYLGQYQLEPKQSYVRLTNLTGESAQQPKMVAFDAMAWTKA